MAKFICEFQKNIVPLQEEMRKRGRYILFWLFLFVGCHWNYCQSIATYEVSFMGDTIYKIQLKTIYVYPELVFKNKRQEKFYYKTIRDVKKTLPYAKKIVLDMAYADSIMGTLPDKKSQRSFWRKYERVLFKKYEYAFRRMTATQGRMLMKLLDRECNRSSYQIIKNYKGKFVADFWQFIAKLFGNDLKEGYNAEEKDQIIERIIVLVEAGQL